MLAGQQRVNFLASWVQRRPFLTVFITNFCIMTLELVAGRLIAPYVGVSLYTWTSVIGIVLAGMTAGNYLGGRLADRWNSPRLAGLALLAAGLFSLLCLIVTGLTGAGVAGARLPYVVSVLVSTSIFFFPSMMLG
ncbi:MAG: fused MFS/spermidine synthase, partial [Candidatus Andersenbacteria bacterium]|nr:fused MFS/spermidine synthase [Candidatus Andersenbacteria bacterium]